MTCIARLQLFYQIITCIPNIHANVIGPHPYIHRRVFNSYGRGQILLADALADHEVEEGGFADFAIADEDDFVFGVVPLKQRLRWEVAMSVRLEMMMIIKLGTLNQIYLILLDSN